MSNQQDGVKNNGPALSDHENSYIRPKIKLRRLIFYAATMGVIVLLYFKINELRQLRDIFSKSNRYMLLLAAILQAVSYYFTSLNYKYILKIKAIKSSLKELYPLSFIIQFINRALPSAGISGQIFFVDYLKNRGISRVEGVGRAVLEVATIYIAFGLMFIASIILIFKNRLLDGHPQIAFLIYGFGLIAVVFMGIFFLLQTKKRSGFIHWILGFFHRHQSIKNEKDREQESQGHVAVFLAQLKENLNLNILNHYRKEFWAAIFWQCMVIFSDIVNLYVLSLALDIKISFVVIFVAFTLTQFISMISFVPGALGVFEGGMSIILISFGIASSSAFTLALLFRAINFWAPMPIGWLLYRRYEKRRHQREGELFV